jgi:peptidoglycan/LPS O-acetylase OafA/YrhL
MRSVAHTQADDTPVIRAGRGGLRYFPELEALRGLAFVLVFLRHSDGIITFGTTDTGTHVSLLGAFVRAGHTAASLFFILSAFLLSLPFLVEAAGGRPVRWSHYYARRALRILPLYYSAVILASVLSAARVSDVLRGLPYLAFLNSVGLTTPMLPYTRDWWSLATEVQFYLLLPLLPLFFRSRLGRGVGLVLLAGYAAAYGAFATGRLHMPTMMLQALLSLSAFGRGPLFLFGILAAGFHLRYGERLQNWCARQPWLARGGGDVALLLVLGALGLLLQRVSFIGFWAAEGRWQVWHVVEGSLWTGVILLLLEAPVRIKPIFSNVVLRRLGRISYSLYLIHHSLLTFSFTALRRLRPGLFSGWGVPTVAVVVVVGATCFALASLTYRVIEQPFLSRKAKID